MISFMSDSGYSSEEGMKISGPIVKTKTGTYCVSLKGPNKTYSLEIDQATLDELIEKIKEPMLEETEEFLDYFGEWNFAGDEPPGEYQ